MLLPDQSHINQVRDALWRRSGNGASVMVGSGFSRNALKCHPDAKSLPTWSDLASKMLEELYPHEICEPLAHYDPLQVAQEYKSAFGPSHLHRFLQDLVRDEDFKPGEIHTRLLRLPWSDIFTTNWDTLLERARTSVPERAYSVVRTKDEIPLANRPRIVKLHGSFRAYFPLIFTEEDYRTYPTEFAPFVNTVQQAMMESVFCLIGFSGNDTNFLKWSGWVRDNLGNAAPKIYLAGWLNLTPHRRRMLEDRNVVPIDLARHPKALKWPDHLRDHYATEWILHTLECGQPYDVTHWPVPIAGMRKPPPTLLEPVEVVTSNLPKEEPDLPSSSDASEESVDWVRQLLDVWRHNREIYPGWLVAPNSVRTAQSWKSREMVSRILEVLPDFAPVERLLAIYEIVWYRELFLQPITSKIEAVAEEALKQIDCQHRTIEGVADPKIEWGTIRQAWRTIALSLVSAARHRFDRNAFDLRIENVSPFLKDSHDIAHRIHHERCLWVMYSMDFEALDDLLKDWRTENCDPVWMMRKAGLLIEMGQGEQGAALVEHALGIIREIPDDGTSLARSSREGWALLSVARFEDFQAFRRRWNELAPLECNALLEKQYIIDAIKGKGTTEEAPSFDLGTQRGQPLRFPNVNRQGAAYRVLRLSEVVGLPPISKPVGYLPVNVAQDMLKRAAETLSTSDPSMAVRLVLRVCTYDQDKTLKRVLSRPRVATLSRDFVNSLAEMCRRVIEYALPRGAGSNASPISWIERMRVAIEVLSRLVLRLETNAVMDILDNALGLYRNDRLARHPWFSDPIRNLLQRSWEALPTENRATRALHLLGAPIVGLDDFGGDNNRYPDPGEVLQDSLPLSRRARDNESRWKEIVGLLTRGLRVGGEARMRASVRVAQEAFRQHLTEAERSQIAKALWNEEHTSPGDLPSGTALFDWVFLVLPEPEVGLAEKCFRQKWLEASRLPSEHISDCDEILWQVGNAIRSLKSNRQPLSLSGKEQAHLTSVVEHWSQTPVPGKSFPYTGDNRREQTRNALSELPSVLDVIHIDGSIGEKLLKKVDSLNQAQLPGLLLIPALVKALPNRLDEFTLLMKMGLSSESDILTKGATAGLYRWLMASADADSQTPSPPDELVREVGVIIATRRRVSLSLALQIAKWVFDKGKDAQKVILRDFALQGLASLVEELRYEREHDQDDNIDVPLLRYHSAQLAQSMATHGSETAPAVVRWLEITKHDPMPEVRYTRNTTLNSGT